MKLIGITGGVGCGKSLITSYLQQKGFDVIDADLIVRDLFLKPEIRERIQKQFQTLDKNELRKIIFQSPEKRKQLEVILHPKVMEKIQSEILKHRRLSAEVFFITIPLLFEKKLETIFDEVISVSCTRENQHKRLKARDGIDISLIQAMIDSQLSTQEKSEKAQHVLTNDGTVAEFENKIDQLIGKIQSN